LTVVTPPNSYYTQRGWHTSKEYACIRLMVGIESVPERRQVLVAERMDTIQKNGH